MSYCFKILNFVELYINLESCTHESKPTIDQLVQFRNGYYKTLNYLHTELNCFEKKKIKPFKRKVEFLRNLVTKVKREDQNSIETKDMDGFFNDEFDDAAVAEINKFETNYYLEKEEKNKLKQDSKTNESESEIENCKKKMIRII